MTSEDRPPTLAELRERRAAIVARIDGIDDGSQPTLPDSRRNAVRALARVDQALRIAEAQADADADAPDWMETA